MKIILKWLAKLNVWYENLEEPKRFIVALIYGLFPFMVLTTFAAAANEIVFTILGLLWILIFVIAFRTWWLFGNLEKYLYDN